MEEFQVKCPHCQGAILIRKNEINCGIFRHGLLKDGTPMNPHSPKEECDRLFETSQIYGCGKPFRVFLRSNELLIETCDYI